MDEGAFLFFKNGKCFCWKTLNDLERIYTGSYVTQATQLTLFNQLLLFNTTTRISIQNSIIMQKQLI